MRAISFVKLPRLACLAGAASAALLAGAFSVLPAAAETAVAPLAPEVVARRPMPRPADVPPPPPITHEIAKRARVSGQIGWLVADIDTGEVIDAAGAHHPFAPASVAKLPTAAFALDQLGPDYRFETALRADGPVVAGVLQGDLTVAGGGDPELDTDALDRLAEALASAGISRVEGFLRLDPGPLPEIAAIMADQPVDAAYNPAVSGLSLNFNRVRLDWPHRAKASDVQVRAQADRLRPATDAVRIHAAPRLPAPLMHSYAEDHERWDIVEAALRRKGGRWLPVRRPAAYAGAVMAGLAAARGIHIAGGTLPPASPRAAAAGGLAEGATTVAARSGIASLAALGRDDAQAEGAIGRVVARHRSRPLDAILREMLRYSTNLTAELCGIAAAREALPGDGLAGLRGTADGADADAARRLAMSAAALNAWAARRAGFAPGDTGFLLANHSGLSLASRISPARLVQLLQAVALEPVETAVHDPRLPGGVAQLLRQHNIAARNVPFDYAGTAVAAKTGTMHFVRGLAGYATTPKGRRLAFAIFANDLMRREQGQYGARSWANRARGMERALIREWVRIADAATPAGKAGAD
ncbi:MAG: D-alanyl-D-alanine carboxypeptidase [Pseudomonadota bacterium]